MRAGALLAVRCLSAWGVRLRLPPFRPALAQESCEPEPLQPLWKIFLLGTGSRIGLVLAAMLAAMILAGEALTLEEAFQQLQRWDANHYIHLIEQGYDGYQENGEHLFLVFFPGYVWAVRLLRLVIPHTALAGTVLSCLCYGGACCYLYRLAGAVYSSRVAWDALLYLSLFPFSFFSGLVMTEGLFLLATAGACWYAWKGRWLAFGLFGALASLTRMTGLLVIAAGVVQLLWTYQPLASPVGKSLSRSWRPVLLRLPLVLLPGVGDAAVPAAEQLGGRRSLCLCHPPGALVSGLSVDLPGGGVHSPVLCGQRRQLLWLVRVVSRPGPVRGRAFPAGLGNPPAGASSGAAGLWLLLFRGHLFPFLAAQRGKVSFHLLRAVFPFGKADGKAPGPARLPAGRGGGALGGLSLRVSFRCSGDVTLRGSGPSS